MLDLKNEEIITYLFLIIAGYFIAKMFSRSCNGFRVGAQWRTPVRELDVDSRPISFDANAAQRSCEDKIKLAWNIYYSAGEGLIHPSDTEQNWIEGIIPDPVMANRIIHPSINSCYNINCGARDSSVGHPGTQCIDCGTAEEGVCNNINTHNCEFIDNQGKISCMLKPEAETLREEVADKELCDCARALNEDQCNMISTCDNQTSCSWEPPNNPDGSCIKMF